jgi:hypothetical protein
MCSTRRINLVIFTHRWWTFRKLNTFDVFKKTAVVILFVRQAANHLINK